MSARIYSDDWQDDTVWEALKSNNGIDRGHHK